MTLSKTKKILFGLGIYFFGTIAPNYMVHSLRVIRDFREVENYPVYILENDGLRLSDEYKLMMGHQMKTLEELTNPWVLIPGSFLWRETERPDLRKRVDEVNNLPLRRA